VGDVDELDLQHFYRTMGFLAVVRFKELQDRTPARGWPVEWQRLRDDLDELQEMTLK